MEEYYNRSPLYDIEFCIEDPNSCITEISVDISYVVYLTFTKREIGKGKDLDLMPYRR